MASPYLVVVGHVTKDLVGDGYVLGGGATYAALAARGLGYAVGVLTRAASDLATILPGALPGIDLCCLDSARTTTFRNLYREGRREQFLLAQADPLTARDVPPAWREARLVLLAPVAGEVGEDLLTAFLRATVGLAAQGWLRRRDAEGRVHPAPLCADPAVLGRAAIVVLSEEDVAGDQAAVTAYAARAQVLALTRGARGVTVYAAGRTFAAPAYPAREVEPTGAGDVFAAAFLIAYHETGDLRAAASFANCAASFAVEAPGTKGVPDREQVLARLAKGLPRQGRTE